MGKKYKFSFDYYDLKIIIYALNLLRTQQINEEKTTDCVDDLIIKLADKLDK